VSPKHRRLRDPVGGEGCRVRPTEQLAQAEGGVARAAYRAALGRLAARPVAAPRAVACHLVTFSGEEALPEQVASLRSFLAHAGRPWSATVVSDGTHRPAARRLLEAIDPVVRVVDVEDVALPELPAAVRAYAARAPLGRKLAVELALPLRGERTLYADADVLFLRGAGVLARLVEDPVGAPRFLLDPEPYLDDRLSPGDRHAPVNSGALLVHRPLDWAPGLRALAALGPAPERWHTEQTVLHLAVHASGGVPLDPARFVVQTDDMRSLRDRHANPAVALRHYTTPVRHKLWCRLARDAVRRTAAR
jgi:hypothetical protein